MRDDLQALLDFHERAALHIRAVLKLLEPAAGQDNGGAGPSPATDSLADILKARVVARPRGKTGRAATAKLLEGFDLVTPRVPEHGAQGLSPLLRHGYLKWKRNGYVRTAKPFIVK